MVKIRTPYFPGLWRSQGRKRTPSSGPDLARWCPDWKYRPVIGTKKYSLCCIQFGMSPNIVCCVYAHLRLDNSHSVKKTRATSLSDTWWDCNYAEKKKRLTTVSYGRGTLRRIRNASIRNLQWIIMINDDGWNNVLEFHGNKCWENRLGTLNQTRIQTIKI